jgi:serine/threonine-protein kinase
VSTLNDAGAITTETCKGVVLGTPVYMAPEQLRDEPCDGRTDVYALVLTLYEVLSGQRAFQATTFPDLVAKIALGDAPALHELVPSLPRALCEIVTRGMHPSPDQRFQDVDSLADALRPYAEVAELPVAAPRRPPVQRRAVWLSLVLAGGLAAIGWWWSRQPPAKQSSSGAATVQPSEVERQSVIQPAAAAPRTLPEPAIDRVVPGPATMIDAANGGGAPANAPVNTTHAGTSAPAPLERPVPARARPPRRAAHPIATPSHREPAPSGAAAPPSEPIQRSPAPEVRSETRPAPSAPSKPSPSLDTF